MLLAFHVSLECLITPTDNILELITLFCLTAKVSLTDKI